MIIERPSSANLLVGAKEITPAFLTLLSKETVRGGWMKNLMQVYSNGMLMNSVVIFKTMIPESLDA